MSIEIRFTLNGRPITATVAAHEDAIDLLRRLDHFGARESCGQGLCGCCTILVDGTTVSGCLTLARLLDGCRVDTVEGLDREGKLDPVQEAFVQTGAFQCGFCTPGFLLMTRQLLDEHPDPDDEQIRNYLSGNLCRCGTYPEILKAVHLAASLRKQHAA